MPKLKGTLIGPTATYTKVGEDMTWPSLNQGDLEGRLRRYEVRDDVTAARFKLASIVAAYRELILMPQKRRNEICSAIREAAKEPEEETK